MISKELSQLKNEIFKELRDVENKLEKKLEKHTIIL